MIQFKHPFCNTNNCSYTSKDNVKSSFPLFPILCKDGSVINMLDFRSFMKELRQIRSRSLSWDFLKDRFSIHLRRIQQQTVLCSMCKGTFQNIFSKYVCNFRYFSIMLWLRMEERDGAGGWLNPVPVSAWINISKVKSKHFKSLPEAQN